MGSSRSVAAAAVIGFVNTVPPMAAIADLDR